MKYRIANLEDIPALVQCRANDNTTGPADPRMGLYLECKHHPQHALKPRVIFVCHDNDIMIGYVGGHLTERYECGGELQYLYVNQQYRRSGIASQLLAQIACWFAEHNAKRICVDVEPGNTGARAFYAQQGAVDLSDYWMVWNDIAASISDRRSD